MPGTIHVNIDATFSTMILMSIAEKTKYGTDIPEVSANGEKKYTAEVAVQYRPEYGMKPVSEVISATITGGDHNAILGIPPGSPVALDGLRCGVSAPEKREDGRLRGGKLYFMASSIRLAGAGGLRPVKPAEQAS
jgi:hypothetical protein